MSLGHFVRRALGPAFPVFGNAYRRFFVNLNAVAASIPQVGPAPEILDIGGGDGEPLNRLLARMPDAHVTMLDLAPSIGEALRPGFAAQVTKLPGTSIRDYISLSPKPFELVIISDVIHHVPPEQRLGFFQDLRDLIGDREVPVYVKDIEPGHWRATASYIADVHISGDANVALISEESLRALLDEVFPGCTVVSTPLMKRDKPNYAVIAYVNRG